MIPEEVVHMLKQHGSFHEGHFVFTAKTQPHSNFYIDCAATLRDPDAATRLGYEMAKRIIGLRPDIIVTPAENAIPLGIPAAHYLAHNSGVSDIRAIIASKGEGKTFVFKRGADKELRGGRIAVLEDLWSTGSSTKSVVDAITACGGQVVAAGAIVNRGNVTAEAVGEVGDFFSLCEVDGVPHIPQPARPCPWCQAGIPMRTDFGHGEKWLERNPDYPRA